MTTDTASTTGCRYCGKPTAMHTVTSTHAVHEAFCSVACARAYNDRETARAIGAEVQWYAYSGTNASGSLFEEGAHGVAALFATARTWGDRGFAPASFRTITTPEGAPGSHPCDGECGRVTYAPRNSAHLYLCEQCAERHAWQATHGHYLPVPVMVSTDHEEFIYPAHYLSEHLWNGFECPFFTRETVERIAADLDRMRETDPSEFSQVERIEWSADDDAFWLIDPTYADPESLDYDPEYTPETIFAQSFEGHALYPVGAWGWTWSLYTPETEETAETADDHGTLPSYAPNRVGFDEFRAHASQEWLAKSE